MKYVFVTASGGKSITKPKQYLVRVGHWQNLLDIDYPVPTDLPCDMSPKEIEQFVSLYLKLTDGKLSNIQYKGTSRCRFCNCRNGNSEYKWTVTGDDGVQLTIVIPSGYLHYVVEHALRPPVQFFRYLVADCNVNKIIPMLKPIQRKKAYVNGHPDPQIISPNPAEYTVF